MNRLFNTKNFYLIVALLSIFTLISAVYIEYVLDAKACKLCLYQRIPYIFAIFVCFFGYSNLKNILWIYVLSLTFLSSFLLSGYHTGIENNIFAEFSGCTANNLKITKPIPNQPINTEIESKLEPRSLCKNSDMIFFSYLLNLL